MLQICDAIVSIELVTGHFACDLQKCKGACCVLGDSGAPLEQNEVLLLKQIFPSIKTFLRPEGINAIEKQGTSVVDRDNDQVTPLVEEKECAYIVFQNGIARCGIENAFRAGATTFRKPISCYLYPVRIKKYKNFEAVNYDKWEICDAARILGKSLGSRVYEFTGPALKVKYGEEWYTILQIEASGRDIDS
jgi:hypothetical protein